MKSKIIAVTALLLVIAATAYTWLSPKAGSNNSQPKRAKYIYDNPLYQEEQREADKEAKAAISIEEFNRLQLAKRRVTKHKGKTALFAPSIIDTNVVNATSLFDGNIATGTNWVALNDYILLDFGSPVTISSVTQSNSVLTADANIKIASSDKSGVVGDTICNIGDLDGTYRSESSEPTRYVKLVYDRLSSGEGGYLYISTIDFGGVVPLNKHRGGR